MPELSRPRVSVEDPALAVVDGLGLGLSLLLVPGQGGLPLLQRPDPHLPEPSPGDQSEPVIRIFTFCVISYCDSYLAFLNFLKFSADLNILSYQRTIIC